VSISSADLATSEADELFAKVTGGDPVKAMALQQGRLIIAAIAGVLRERLGEFEARIEQDRETISQLETRITELEDLLTGPQ
jgi:hypothetical protein